MTKVTPELNDRIFNIASDALTVCAPHDPDVVARLVLLAVPKMSAPRGKCSFLPNGLPLLRSVTEDNLEMIFEPLGTATMDEVAKEDTKGSRGRCKEA